MTRSSLDEVRDLTRDDLIRRLGRGAVRPGAAEVDLAVAESLLGVTLPAGLVRLLRLSNGLRVGVTEVHDVDRIIARSQEPDVQFRLPSHLVIGVAGAGRSVVMHTNRDAVSEVPDDPWDGGDMHQSAAEPLDLFLRYGGVPLGEREPYASIPGAVAARDRALSAGREAATDLARIDVTRNAGTLAGDAIVSGVAVTGLADRDEARARYERSEGLFLNLSPRCPIPGGDDDYGTLRNEIAARLRPAFVDVATGTSLPGFIDTDGRSIAVDTVTAVLFGYAAEVFAACLAPGVPTPAAAMLAVLGAGHIPLGLDDAGHVVVH
ncbi:SMI1/KNR4 family protein [Leucobacter weissii]|uniref:SMI1/KNR4 family protein n=1 Tax=Leucobacter weissii TaxID=1983706 RepID=A0A939MM15_9MICO|nr:SMI1/KNR4 family protein [Leucobacter weissii]MBO1901277.1 SMI1/KNR4 family protein [Leucobacter weissii]